MGILEVDYWFVSCYCADSVSLWEPTTRDERADLWTRKYVLVVAFSHRNRAIYVDLSLCLRD
jgi:hypothetical protein